MIYLSQFLDKKVMVLGLGRTGMSLVLNLLHCYCRKIYVCDDNANRINQILEGKDINSLLFKDGYNVNIEYCDLTEDGWKKQLQDIGYIIVSPGIDFKKHKVIKEALKIGNIKITNDIEEFVKSTLNNTHIAISGTNGKSTTCSLITHILSQKDMRVQLGGNIGKPASDMIYYSQNSTYVLELSSFQLEVLEHSKFDIVGIINISEDHQDRYASFQDYAKTKESIYGRIKKGGYALFSADCVNVYQMYQQHSKCQDFKSILLSTQQELKEGIAILPEDAKHNTLKVIDNFFGSEFVITPPKSLRGIHNAENLAFAYTACRIRGVNAEQFQKALPTFCGLPHRVEQFLQTENAIFIDDSKATNTDAMLKSVSSFKNIMLIVGGVKKDNNFQEIIKYKDNITKCFVIGKEREFYLNTLADSGIDFEDVGNIKNAVKTIRKAIAKLPDFNYTVMLCPAAASFDQFTSYIQRGRLFQELIVEEFEKSK